MDGLVYRDGEGKALTTSRLVAEKFGKRHGNLLRRIEKLQCSDEFNRLNFEPTYYNDRHGRIQPEYLLTRDGFTFLVMGFTGKDAARFKEEYIAAFNEMEQRVRQSTVPLSPAQQLLEQAKLMAAHEQQLAEHSDKIARLEQQVHVAPEFYSVTGYAALNGISVDRTTASKIGRKASRICKDRGIATGTVPHERWGTVKAYPLDVLEVAFRQMQT